MLQLAKNYFRFCSLPKKILLLIRTIKSFHILRKFERSAVKLIFKFVLSIVLFIITIRLGYSQEEQMISYSYLSPNDYARTVNEQMYFDYFEGTIEFRFLLYNNGNRGAIFSKNRTQYNQGDIYSYFDWSNNNIFVVLQDSYYPYETMMHPNGLTWSVEQWYHIALTWNYSGIKLYVNGLLLDELPEIYFSILRNNYDLFLGAEGYKDHDNNYTIGNFFNGSIDEFRIWNHSRSQYEIYNTMNNELGEEYYATADSGLFAYYRFDELENLEIGENGLNDIRDLTQNQNHLDIIHINPTNIEEVPLNNLTYSLFQNYPNPFNPSTLIRYSVTNLTWVEMKVYDILGKEVALLVSEEKQPGSYEVYFDAENISTGTYFYTLRTENNVLTKQMILIK